jgi:hypothetical protein
MLAGELENERCQPVSSILSTGRRATACAPFVRCEPFLGMEEKSALNLVPVLYDPEDCGWEVCEVCNGGSLSLPEGRCPKCGGLGLWKNANWAQQIIRDRRERVKFSLGECFETFNVLSALHDAGQNAEEFLEKHEFGDWGALSVDHKEANEYNLRHRLRLLSVYTTVKGVRFLVVTAGDRSKTILCLLDEYQQLKLEVGG